MTEPYAVRVGELLRAKNLQLATAESCTGGLIASLITDRPGSSEYFFGGVVVYAYRAKEVLLDIPHDLLMAQGAVNETVARLMAQNARAKFGVDLALSTTGILGPGGATPTKPVGLVYIGLATADSARVERLLLTGDRVTNKQATALAALTMLCDYLEQL